MYYYKAILPLGTASRKCSHSTLTNGLSLKPGHRRCPGSAAYQSLHTRGGVLRIALPVGFPAYHGTVSRDTSTGSHTVVRPTVTELHGTPTQGTEGALDGHT